MKIKIIKDPCLGFVTPNEIFEATISDDLSSAVFFQPRTTNYYYLYKDYFEVLKDNNFSIVETHEEFKIVSLRELLGQDIVSINLK